MKKTLLLTSAIAASMVIPAHAEESSSMPNLKILNEFSTGWVRNFNPWFGGRSDFAYESLYIFDILDSKNVHPWLATGYELSDDLTVLTVDLREGVLWSDGKPFTADDVVFTYEYPKAHPEIDTGGVSGKVDKVEKVNDLQVKIYLKEPNAFAARDVLGETVRIVLNIFGKVMIRQPKARMITQWARAHSQKSSVLHHKFMFSVVTQIIGIKTSKLTV